MFQQVIFTYSNFFNYGGNSELLDNPTSVLSMSFFTLVDTTRTQLGIKVTPGIDLQFPQRRGVPVTPETNVSNAWDNQNMVIHILNTTQDDDMVSVRVSSSADLSTSYVILVRNDLRPTLDEYDKALVFSGSVVCPGKF